MTKIKNLFERDGHKITILNMGHGNPHAINIINLNTKNRIFQAFQLFYLFYKLKPDVFHYFAGSFRSFWLGGYCAILGCLFRKKMVFSLLSGTFKDLVANSNFIQKKIIKVVLGLNHRIIGCSKEIVDVLSNVVKDKQKINFINNNFIYYTNGDGNIPEKVLGFLTKHSPTLITSGAMVHHYGFDILLTALNDIKQIYPNVGLVLSNIDYMDQNDYRKMITMRIRKANLEWHTLEISNVPDLTCIIAKTDLLIRPARRDGDSICVREALSLGIPVVASNTGLRPEQAVLFKSGDADDLLGKIKMVLENPDLIRLSSCVNEPVDNYIKLKKLYMDVAQKGV
jgi:glycosyltransferase involved in cell wall biosynthesis